MISNLKLVKRKQLTTDDTELHGGNRFTTDDTELHGGNQLTD